MRGLTKAGMNEEVAAARGSAKYMSNPALFLMLLLRKPIKDLTITRGILRP